MCMTVPAHLERYTDIVGIDIADEDFQVCIRAKTGELESGKFANTAKGFDKLKKWLSTRVQTPHMIMEATGRYWKDLAKWSHAQGFKVTVLNPRQSRDFAGSQLEYNKSDEIDAKVILRFGETAEFGKLRLWQPPSAAREELEEVHMLICATKKMIRQEKSRLKCRLTSEWVKQQIREHIKYLKEQLDTLTARAKSIIKSDEKLRSIYKKLISIIGFGEATVLFLISRIDFDQFNKGRQLIALAGLVPRLWESGKSVRKKAAISRVGHSSLRAALYFPAISSMTHDPAMIEFAEKLRKKGKPEKVIICSVMSRLLLTAFAVVRDDRPFEVRSRGSQA